MNVELPSLSPGLKAGLLNVVLGSTPAVVLFLMIPMAIYLPNQQELRHNLMVVLPFLVLLAGWLVLMALLATLLPRIAQALAVPLFFLGLYFGLADMLAPVQLGLITGEAETIQEPLQLTLIEIALAILLLGCAWKLPTRFVRRLAPPLVAVLLLSEIAVVAIELDPASHFGGQTGNSAGAQNAHNWTLQTTDLQPPPHRQSGGGNIYHFVLDGYSNRDLLPVLEQLQAETEMEGFTFFRNARSNYFSTYMSIPSFMSGTYYHGGSLEKWWAGWEQKPGILRAAYDVGYTVSSYQTYEHLRPAVASFTKVLDEFLSKEARKARLFFLDLWVVRIAPNFLQDEAYAKGAGTFGKAAGQARSAQGERASASVAFMREVIRDESERPPHGQYVYAHILLPHGPYVLDGDCATVLEFATPIRLGDKRKAQSVCTTRLMLEFVRKLKSLGRYQSASIIFQSDHGSWRNTGDDLDAFMSEQDEKLLGFVEKKYSVSDRSRFDNRTRVLILVKPPSRSAAPLAVSNLPVQLIDIAPTIAELIGSDASHMEGKSLYSPDFPRDRALQFFMGYHRNRGGKISNIIGIPEGDFDHVSFSNERGWKLHEPIRFTWP